MKYKFVTVPLKAPNSSVTVNLYDCVLYFDPDSDYGVVAQLYSGKDDSTYSINPEKAGELRKMMLALS